MRIFLLLLFIKFGLPASVSAQNILEYKLDNNTDGKSLETLFHEISDRTGARFYYLTEWIDHIQLENSYEGQTLRELLDHVFQPTELTYISMYPKSLVLIKDPTHAIRRQNVLELAKKEKRSIEQHQLGKPGEKTLTRPGQVTIQGQVMDAETDEPIPFATLQVLDTRSGTTTDENGRYQLTLVPGPYVVTISFVDYEPKVVDLEAYQDGVINFQMDKKSLMLNEVVIEDRSAQELATSRMGQTQLTVPEMKRAPSFLGEPDLVKSIQSLPGVTSVGEAASGFNVRGGSVDQNLILYDGLPVFNSSHVFGFFTAFNPDAIRDVSFHKGGIPAEFGGRVSSVLDIKSKDGNYESWEGKVGIGMITSNAMIEGPLKKEKTALAASIRSTYSNWLVHSIRTDYADLRQSQVSFYDGTVKLAHLFSNRTKLSFTGYSSRDRFRLMGDSTYQWSNFQSSLRLDHQFSGQLNAEFIGGFVSYGYQVTNADPLTASRLSFGINSSVLKARFSYNRDQHQINFGWQMIHYRFDPGKLEPDNMLSNARTISLDQQKSMENAIYFSDNWHLASNLDMELGLRVPLFLSFGPASVYQYQDGMPREVNSITDTVFFRKGRVTKAYWGVSPRISFRWMLSSDQSVKFGYNRIYQFLHLVTNTTAVTPVDIWQPSGRYFKPQRADQVSLGYYMDFGHKRYSASTEVFYKDIDNVLDFKDGAQLILNEHLETELLQGSAFSYGAEVALIKNFGILTGSLNYTYSRAFRVIRGNSVSESINSGEKYPANFDQPHVINFSWKYQFSHRHYFTGNFTYHSGRPVTIPLSVFALENSSVAYFSARNQYRIADYHRLDLALVIEGSNRRKKNREGTWVFSVYNVYGRKNPYTIFFRNSEEGLPEPYQLSIIGTIFPSISYNLKFK